MLYTNADSDACLCRCVYKQILLQWSNVFVGEIRLGGGSLFEGWVEIYLNGEWLAVCGHTWDPLDAAVACRQLGFAEALNTFSSLSQNSYGRAIQRKGAVEWNALEVKIDSLTVSKTVTLKMWMYVAKILWLLVLCARMIVAGKHYSEVLPFWLSWPMLL